jgi:phytoene dehydrogenase-like protein
VSILKESREETYDVIVVGAGLGGLSAAALLARSAKRVLVIERHDRPGGYAHSFQRKRYIFDARRKTP